MEDFENISEEGKKEVERLRREYVISEEELITYKEQKLLENMYECQYSMGELLDGGEKDPHYIIMSHLIERLEKHLQNKQKLR